MSGSPVELDDIDRAMVAELVADGRVPIRELADRVGVSRATAYKRLDRLVETGVVKGFTARIDPVLAGTPVAALVTVQIEQHAWRTVREQVRAMPEVERAILTTGKFDLLLVVRTTDVRRLRDVVLERLNAMPEVRSTRTVFVLDEFDE